MGKRKERRLAAMSAAGRRVKLDLFAEPSGDLGGSRAQDEVGGDDDWKNHAGLPNSPSSSGHGLENPLLLLEQYSDDELDEGSSKGLNHAISESSSADLDYQVKVAADKECEDIGINADKDHADQKVEQHNTENVSASLDALQKLEENGIRENDVTDPAELPREMDSTEGISVPATSDIQVIGDVSSGWNLVLHEESNRYYYWNTLTGETSWEVPDVLAQGTELTFEQKTAADTGGKENADEVTHESSSNLKAELDDAIATQLGDGSKVTNSNLKTNKIYECRPEMEVWNEGSTGDIPDDEKMGHDINRSDIKRSSGPISALCHETSSPGNSVSSRQSDSLLGNGCAAGADSEKYMHDVRDHGEHETGSNLSSHLVRHCEYLLERLKSLNGFKGHLQGHDQISRYLLEVEIRLCDIKSLLSYGSSLLPFWLHSERQLKQLESSINDEIFLSRESAKMIEVEVKHEPQKSISANIKADANEKKASCCTTEGSHASDYVSVITEISKVSRNEAYSNAAILEHVSSGGYPNALSGSGADGKVEIHGVAIPAELTTDRTVLHSGEDIDMDVEMEVDDAIPASNTIIGDELDAQYCDPTEQPNPPAEHESLVLEEGSGIPPPPDDYWIPPPPPDNEPFPPPPPDEPPESPIPPPPADLEMVQPFSYGEQYNLTYPGSNFEYYGQTNTEVQGSEFFAHANGCQIAVPLPSLYYEAVPNTYPSVAPVLVNPIEPIAYYGLQDGMVPPVPVVSGIPSSGLHSASGHESLGSDEIGLVDANVEVGCTLLPNAEVDISAGCGETEKASLEVPFAPTTVQAPSTISVMEGISVSLTPAVANTAITATAPTAQSKVSRSKKRTVAVVSTLRSNKKVSSLVDKWKAAKEELHEDEEDEPENPYEILQKKRKREIEEWRAQQIASGEAKENANFQPLGGDWRERVKRKRAQLVSKAIQTALEDLTDGNQQPDLNEISRDLPSGWQAYWDESSKQVYYGHSATSETTWIRPS